MKYMEKENINLEHLNGSLLHLNKYGDSAFANNFLIGLSRIGPQCIAMAVAAKLVDLL